MYKLSKKEILIIALLILSSPITAIIYIILKIIFQSY